jgi:hypothetical protein
MDVMSRRSVLAGAAGAALLGVVGAPLLQGNQKGEVMTAGISTTVERRPAIDRAAPAKTEQAVFALG